MTIQLERFDIAVSETDVHVYSLNVGDTCSSFLTIKNSAAGKFFALKLSRGGPRPKIIFNVIFVEGRQSYQMLFTGSKNIDPSWIYRIFKIAKYIQLPCGRALYSRLSQNFKF